MTQVKGKISPMARWLALLISVVVMFLGACVVIDGYAPGRFTRFGFAEALSGVKAKEFGAIMVLLGCLPLLLFLQVFAPGDNSRHGPRRLAHFGDFCNGVFIG